MGIALSAERPGAARRNLPAVRQDASDRPPRHSCECRCASCEAQGAGYFAQLAALRGAPVFALLTAMRGGGRSHE